MGNNTAFYLQLIKPAERLQRIIFDSLPMVTLNFNVFRGVTQCCFYTGTPKLSDNSLYPFQGRKLVWFLPVRIKKYRRCLTSGLNYVSLYISECTQYKNLTNEAQQNGDFVIDTQCSEETSLFCSMEVH
jgi:hypothetical protein